MAKASQAGQTDKQRALEAFLASNEKKYGEEAIKFGNDIPDLDIDFIPTGSILLDDALGCRGVPCGRLIELYGDEGSGKTSLAVGICANAIKKFPDDAIGWVDVEHAFNWKYAAQLGLPRDRVAFSQPSSGEQALDQVLQMCLSGAFRVVVLDSVGGLSTKRQLEKEMDEATIGEVARLLSNNVKKITDAAGRTGTLVIFINQLRINIGAYGGPPTTMGGKALRFFASQRIHVKKRDTLVNKDKVPIGQAQEYIIKKNRMGVPFKEVETEFYFGRGFNPFKEIIDIAIEKGLIAKGGAWYYPHPEDKTLKFQGKDPMVQWYSENEGEFNALKTKYDNLIETGLVEEVEQSAESI